MSPTPEGKADQPTVVARRPSLYFISDRDGIPNIYRRRLATGDRAGHRRSTRGERDHRLSPALWVASRTVAFSVYQDSS